jgi:hypothetical protein
MAAGHADTAEQHRNDTEAAVKGIATLMANLTSPNKTLAALVELYVVGGSQTVPFDTVRDPATTNCDATSNGLTDPENGLLLVAFREGVKADSTLTITTTIAELLAVLNR